MKILKYILRALFISFMCYSASVMAVILIFIGFGISNEHLSPLHLTGGFVVFLLILDIFFINTNQIKKLLGIGKKKEMRRMPYQQMVGRALRTNKKPVKVNFIMANYDNHEEHF